MKHKTRRFLMKRNLKKIKLIELIIDWNLWPRYKAENLDHTNVKRMKDAIQAGINLPPILVNSKDLRIIDGFHRFRAYQSLFGDDMEITVEMKDYDNDADMFLDSARLNSVQGLPLSPQDKAHVVYRLKRMKVPMIVIAEALGMSKDRAKEFYEKRIAKTESGEVLILANGASDLAELNRPLNEHEEKHARSANGCKASVLVALLLNALRANDYKVTEKFIENCISLYSELSKIIGS